MAETSFPIKNLPMSDMQWGQVTAGLGSGVLGSTAGNYALVGVNNANNTAQLSSGGSGNMSQAIVSGFYHRIDANHTISLPAISSGAVTYYVGLTYDSAKHADPAGPVSITVTTSKPGGPTQPNIRYLSLYEVPRLPNELLTDAIKKARVRRVLISPTLSVASIDELPDPATMMQGTMCQTTNLNMIWRVSGDRWVPINATAVLGTFDMPGWRVAIPSGGIELTYLESGKRLAKISDAQIVRTGAQFTQGTGYQEMGTLIPDSLRGSAASQSQASLAVGAAVYPGTVRLDAESGKIQFRLASGSQTIMPSHVILFSASWVIA